MNNKELYQKTFSRLHASEDLELEDIIMKKKKFRLPKMAACFMAALVLTSVLGVGAYAAVSGDFLGTIKVFFNGKATDVDFYEQEDGSLLGRMKSDSKKEEELEVWVASDKDLGDLSKEITNDSININFENQPVVTEEEGRILISYQDQVIDITEEIEKNGRYEYVYEDDGEKIMMVSFTEEGDINTAFCDVEEGNEIEK